MEKLIAALFAFLFYVLALVLLVWRGDRLTTLELRVENLEIGNCFDIYNGRPHGPDGRLLDDDNDEAMKLMDQCFARIKRH